MKTIDNIPTSKIQRATRMVQTGAKVGVNYLKYYGDKITKNEKEAKQRLNENNAEDIYDGLKKIGKLIAKKGLYYFALVDVRKIPDEGIKSLKLNGDEIQVIRA